MGALGVSRDRSRSARDSGVDTDADLLRGLHREHGPALWAFLLQLTGGDRGRAEDAMQETLLRAWRQPALLRQQRSPRSWLFTVARHVVIDEWRATKRRPVGSWDEVQDLPDAAGSDGTDQALQSMLVSEALRDLTPEHQAVLLECYFRGSTAAQAAARLDIPVGTVKSRLHYALHALRLALQEVGVVA